MDREQYEALVKAREEFVSSLEQSCDSPTHGIELPLPDLPGDICYQDFFDFLRSPPKTAETATEGKAPIPKFEGKLERHRCPPKELCPNLPGCIDHQMNPPLLVTGPEALRFPVTIARPVPVEYTPDYRSVARKVPEEFITAAQNQGGGEMTPPECLCPDCGLPGQTYGQPQSHNCLYLCSCGCSSPWGDSWEDAAEKWHRTPHHLGDHKPQVLNMPVLEGLLRKHLGPDADIQTFSKDGAYQRWSFDHGLVHITSDAFKGVTGSRLEHLKSLVGELPSNTEYILVTHKEELKLSYGEKIPKHADFLVPEKDALPEAFEPNPKAPRFSMQDRQHIKNALD